MLKPTDMVQRAEAVGRPACSPPVFISSHFDGAPRLGQKRGKEKERNNEIERGSRSLWYN